MLILVIYFFHVQNFMLIPKKKGNIFLGHFKVIFRPLEVMTPRSHLFIYFLNTCLTSRVTQQKDRNCLGNIIKFEKKRKNPTFLPTRGHFKVNYCKVFKYTY